MVFGWSNHLLDLNPILLREFIVPLIVRGNTHNRAGTVIHKDVVRHPHWHALAVIWIHREMSGVDAVFFYVGDIATFSGLLLLGDKLRDFQAQVGIQRR